MTIKPPKDPTTDALYELRENKIELQTCLFHRAEYVAELCDRGVALPLIAEASGLSSYAIRKIKRGEWVGQVPRGRPR